MFVSEVGARLAIATSGSGLSVLQTGSGGFSGRTEFSVRPLTETRDRGVTSLS